MSYLGDNFDPDIFISYAHLDNRPLTEGQKGWIDLFHRALEDRLATRLGEEAACYLDLGRLQGNHYIDAELLGQVQKAAVLISVLSPSYLHSDYCLKELATFCSAAEKTGGLRFGNECRVFKVVKLPPPQGEHDPPEIQQLRGYDFYELDSSKQKEQEIDPVMGDDTTKRHFRQKVDDVAVHVQRLFESLRPGRVRGSPQLAPLSGTTVYLAETTPDLNTARDQIRRELEQHGHRVLPDCALPWDGAEFERVVKGQLEQAQLSIHLIGASSGGIPGGQKRSIVSLQYRLAMECGRGANSRLVWLPPGLQPAGVHERRFIEYLQTDAKAQDGADLLQTPLEEFKTVIRDTLDRQRRAAAKPAAPAAKVSGPPRVYLVCDQQDRGAVAPLEDYLYEQGCEVTPPAFEGDVAQIREDHKENLLLCDAALVYCGAAGEPWFRAQMRDLAKAPGYGRAAPIPAIVYLGPPESDWKQRFRTHQGPVTKHFADFAPESLTEFLTQLGVRK